MKIQTEIRIESILNQLKSIEIVILKKLKQMCGRIL